MTRSRQIATVLGPTVILLAISEAKNMQTDRQIRELALARAAGRLADAVHLERLPRAPGRQGQPRAQERRWDLA
jgi:hypothetical protein